MDFIWNHLLRTIQYNQRGLGAGKQESTRVIDLNKPRKQKMLHFPILPLPQSNCQMVKFIDTKTKHVQHKNLNVKEILTVYFFLNLLHSLWWQTNYTIQIKELWNPRTAPYQPANIKITWTSILMNPTKGDLIWRIKLQEPTIITTVTIYKNWKQSNHAEK